MAKSDKKNGSGRKWLLRIGGGLLLLAILGTALRSCLGGDNTPQVPSISNPLSGDNSEATGVTPGVGESAVQELQEVGIEQIPTTAFENGGTWLTNQSAGAIVKISYEGDEQFPLKKLTLDTNRELVFNPVTGLAPDSDGTPDTKVASEGFGAILAGVNWDQFLFCRKDGGGCFGPRSDGTYQFPVSGTYVLMPNTTYPELQLIQSNGEGLFVLTYFQSQQPGSE